MSSQYWFKKRKTLSEIGRPASWQGWVVVLVAVFFVAILAQMISVWIVNGFQPLATGVWSLAMFFVLLGAFFKICNMKTPPPDTDL